MHRTLKIFLFQRFFKSFYGTEIQKGEINFLVFFFNFEVLLNTPPLSIFFRFAPIEKNKYI